MLLGQVSEVSLINESMGWESYSNIIENSRTWLVRLEVEGVFRRSIIRDYCTEGETEPKSLDSSSFRFYKLTYTFLKEAKTTSPSDRIRNTSGYFDKTQVLN